MEQITALRFSDPLYFCQAITAIKKNLLLYEATVKLNTSCYCFTWKHGALERFYFEALTGSTDNQLVVSVTETTN